MAAPETTNNVTVRKLTSLMNQLWTKIKNALDGKQDDLGISSSGDATKFLNEKGQWAAPAGTAQVQADWAQTTTTAVDYIKNKPQNLVQDASYVHTDNNYSTVEKDKLSGISPAANKVEASSTNGKIKIDAIDTTVYTHPSTTAATAAAKKVGKDVLGHVVLGDPLSKSDVGLGNVTNDAQVKRTEMGAASGVATLGSDGKVPSSQLPTIPAAANNATITIKGNGADIGSFTVDTSTNKSVDVSLQELGATTWTDNAVNYNPILSVSLGTSPGTRRSRFLLVVHPDNNGDGADDIIDVYLGAANGQLNTRQVILLSNANPATSQFSILNANFKFGTTWSNGVATLWIKCNLDGVNRKKRFYLLKASGTLDSVNYRPQASTSSPSAPSGFTEIDIYNYGVSRTTAINAVGSTTQPVYVDTSGQVQPCTELVKAVSSIDTSTMDSDVLYVM